MTASDTETAGMTIFQHLANITGNAYSYGISAGDDVKSIAGIEKTGKYSLTVHMSEFDATSIYNMSFTIVPLHYYGDPALFNGVDSFGFVKGDLSGVRAKTTQPLGCGPYVFESYNNGVVTLKANEYYYTGKPVIDTILFQESTDSDYVPGIIAGILLKTFITGALPADFAGWVTLILEAITVVVTIVVCAVSAPSIRSLSIIAYFSGVIIISQTIIQFLS